MDGIGLAELSLYLVVALALVVVGGGLATGFLIPARPTALRRARRMSALRTTVATSSSLAVFAVAIALHIQNPLWEGVTFAMGPLVATTTGLAVFAALPPPTIEGAVRRRGAELEQRHVNRYSSPIQRWLMFALFSVVVGAVLALGFTSKTAPDGRSLCTAVFPSECTAGGPFLYPGWLFAAPALFLIATLLAAMMLALRRIIDAPAAAWRALVEVDTALRVGAVRLVFRIASTALVLTLGMFLGAAGIPLLNAGVLETGLSAEGDAIAGVVGFVLVATSAFALLSGLLLAFVAILSTVGRPHKAHTGILESSA